ncbi:MAG: hypothetical protein IT538_15995, partial [Variibacter sp.]|nr:hypothetical protein [Variibacter sp.]
AGPSNAELVRAVQTELKRVNCGDMDATGEWNKETEEAVVRFNDHARWRFDWKQPSASLLSALVRSGEYACALECVDGYKADGGACVPAADASPRPLPLPVVKRPRR